jgi:hypothetical protein
LPTVLRNLWRPSWWRLIGDDPHNVWLVDCHATRLPNSKSLGSLFTTDFNAIPSNNEWSSKLLLCNSKPLCSQSLCSAGLRQILRAVEYNSASDGEMGIADLTSRPKTVLPLMVVSYMIHAMMMISYTHADIESCCYTSPH